MKRVRLTVLVCALSASACVMAQEPVPFNGVVKDLLGKPLKKVRVYVHDEKRYATSDKLGRFGLTDVQAGDTLHLKYNKKMYVIPVEGKKSMSITLGDQLDYNANEDDELINLGMMYVKRREYSSPHNGLSGDELVKQGFTSIVDAVRAKVPGVQMLGGVLTIRGVHSLTLSSEPLYVVDGVETTSLDNIDIHDVDRIEVLKDGAMYGSKGGNGVIVVTTKKGPKK